MAKARRVRRPRKALDRLKRKASMEKLCHKCGETKPVTAFSKDGSRADGLRYWCKACVATCFREYYHKNREIILAKGAKYRRLNSDKHLAACRKWRKLNSNKRKDINRRWRKSNPNKCRDLRERYRARKLGATIEKIERAIVYDRDKGLCHICGRAVFHDNWHLDHIIPLAKGGEHSYRNVAVSHPGCNRRKNCNLLSAVT